MDVPRYGFQIKWSDEDAAYLATCPAFEMLSAFGETPDEALHEAQTALSLFVEEYQAEGIPLPPAEPAHA